MARTRYDAKPDVDGTTGNTWTGKLMALFCIALVAGLALAIAMYLRTSNEHTVTGSTTNVKTVDDNTFELTVDIERDDTGEDSYCIVTALNYDVTEVGRREIFIPAGGKDTQRMVVHIATTEPAVSGDVYGCSYTVPDYLIEQDYSLE
ncbi:MAG: DUF4307 domain-containing protein [Corynebacterium sp.]|nr:DUF4307 domain-containing protein [Corynebacterium sp.]